MPFSTTRRGLVQLIKGNLLTIATEAELPPTRYHVTRHSSSSQVAQVLITTLRS